jgi:hypothetical protein
LEGVRFAKGSVESFFCEAAFEDLGKGAVLVFSVFLKGATDDFDDFLKGSAVVFFVFAKGADDDFFGGSLNG